MTLPAKIQLYLGSESKDIEASMAKTGKSLSPQIRDQIKKSYEAETIIRNLLGILDTLSDHQLVICPTIQQAKDYIK